MSGLAWPGLSVACPRNWRAWSVKNAERLSEYDLGAADPSSIFDGVVPVNFEQHGCPTLCCHSLTSHTSSQSAEIGARLPSYTWDCVDDSIPGTVCPHLLHPVSYDVP